MQKKLNTTLLIALTTLATACGTPTKDQSTAPGAPGDPSVWSYSGKTGIGTAYETYTAGQYSDNGNSGKISRVWFSLAQGIITETMFGLIHQAQIKDLQFIIKGENFLDQERTDTISDIQYLHTDKAGRPLSLAYKITNRDRENRYQIEKHIFTDPDRDTLFLRVTFRAHEKGITPYLLLNPHINNTGSNDSAEATATGLYAWEGNTHLALKSSGPLKKTSAGFLGKSDSLTDLQNNGTLDWTYTTTGAAPGNVALTAQLQTLSHEETTYDFAIGFGPTRAASEEAATQTLATGYEKVLAHYNGQGQYLGWEDYLAGLQALQPLSATATDNGRLLHTSALVLKAQEDKTHAGALIASLSNPWGDTASAENPQTGYKAVWPRDFYQCAMAMLALGDTETPLVAFEYLQKVQVKSDTPGNKGAGGWFLQKTHVDGEIEWVGVQLDQTAMPIMLGWKLWQAGILTDAAIAKWYAGMLKPAADFLVSGGDVDIDWNQNTIEPPRTQQERWEEQWGYSPSTTAAVIAGLVAAADIATAAGDQAAAERYLTTADRYAADIESTLFTTTGTHSGDTTNGKTANNGRYFIRITQNPDPNDNGKLLDNNGRPGLNEKEILDAGFLELVRYGVRAADNPFVLDTLTELDDTTLPDNLRVKYEFTFPGEQGTYPGWRRYGNDGYGDSTADGGNYANNSPHGRGRVWPFFTGERGHYELALAKAKSETLSAEQIEKLKSTYVKAMELFANEGLMLPEQVWDGVGGNDANQYRPGEGTNSATPLAWTHAEYIKLLRSLTDQQVWDSYSIVRERYK